MNNCSARTNSTVKFKPVKRNHDVAKTCNFTKRDTLIIKGIAITMLIFYHCFGDESRITDNVVFLFSKSKEMWVFNACNVCVGMFAVLSAYGITKASDKYFNIDVPDACSLKGYYRHRLLSLLPNYWIVFIGALVGSAIKGNISVYAGKGTPPILACVIDSLGLSFIFGTPSLTGTWWYISFTILIILLLPMINYIRNRFHDFGLIGLYLALCFLFRQFDYNNLTAWWFAVILGHLAARHDWFVWIECWADKGSILPKIGKFFLLAFVTLIMLYCRQSSSDLYRLFRGLAPMSMVCFCYTYIGKIPILDKGLFFLGKHSMNIFLIHTFYRYNWFHDFVYSFNYPIIIAGVLLLMTMGTSIVLEWFKNMIRYKDFFRV